MAKRNKKVYEMNYDNLSDVVTGSSPVYTADVKKYCILKDGKLTPVEECYDFMEYCKELLAVDDAFCKLYDVVNPNSSLKEKDYDKNYVFPYSKNVFNIQKALADEISKLDSFYDNATESFEKNVIKYFKNDFEYKGHFKKLNEYLENICYLTDEIPMQKFLLKQAKEQGSAMAKKIADIEERLRIAPFYNQKDLFQFWNYMMFLTGKEMFKEFKKIYQINRNLAIDCAYQNDLTIPTDILHSFPFPIVYFDLSNLSGVFKEEFIGNTDLLNLTIEGVLCRVIRTCEGKGKINFLWHYKSVDTNSNFFVNEMATFDKNHEICISPKMRPNFFLDNDFNSKDDSFSYLRENAEKYEGLLKKLDEFKTTKYPNNENVFDKNGEFTLAFLDELVDDFTKTNQNKIDLIADFEEICASFHKLLSDEFDIGFNLEFFKEIIYVYVISSIKVDNGKGGWENFNPYHISSKDEAEKKRYYSMLAIRFFTDNNYNIYNAYGEEETSKDVKKTVSINNFIAFVHDFVMQYAILHKIVLFNIFYICSKTKKLTKNNADDNFYIYKDRGEVKEYTYEENGSQLNYLHLSRKDYESKDGIVYKYLGKGSGRKLTKLRFTRGHYKNVWHGSRKNDEQYAVSTYIEPYLSYPEGDIVESTTVITD